MTTSFLDAVKQATPRQVLKLVNSPFGGKYLQIDDAFIKHPVLRLEAVKAFFRSYQNHRRTLAFLIEEVEVLIAKAKECGLSTDEFFDQIFHRAGDDVLVARFLFSTFAYLRNELISTSSS
jgi:hypothetical protein